MPLWRLESLYEEILGQDKRQTDDQRESKAFVDKLKSQRKRAETLIGEKAGKVSAEEDRALLKQLQEERSEIVKELGQQTRQSVISSVGMPEEGSGVSDHPAEMMKM